MSILFKHIKDLKRDELQNLFFSVGWDSGNYPDKLQLAIKNSHNVISAWDKDRLVGLMNAISDGAMTAYFQYLLVHPDYQGQGIGKELVERMLAEYKDYARKVLIAYEKETEFYKACGFEVGEGRRPMLITFLKP